MDKTYSLYGQIAEIVRKETRYLRHYIGTVCNNVDPEKKGKVLVLVPELGWDTPNTAMWCSPRQRHKMDIPSVGEWIEIYFIAGDITRPVYIEQANEIIANVPLSYTGLPTQHVLFESPILKKSILFDDASGTLTVDFNFLNLGKLATQPAVLGTVLVSYLSAMVTAINAALAAKLDGGGTPGTLTPPAGVLSTKVKLT